MKLNQFRKKMQKPIFKLVEAEQIAWETAPATLRLQLHQWARRGELLRLRRGVYCFPEQVQDRSQVARVLYEPAYISLESALHHYGLIPDVVFAITLVTPKAPRKFVTPLGTFLYHRIKSTLFWGYDPETLMAEAEKAVVDYLYLNRHRLIPDEKFWLELRWQNLAQLDFRKLNDYGKKTSIPKVLHFIDSLKRYGKS